VVPGNLPVQLPAGRTNLGAVFTAASDGFMYVQSGCDTLNSFQTCTSIDTNTQIAQINADGSLGTWATVAASGCVIVCGWLAATRMAWNV